ncbi:hypothetical protein ABMY20_12790 [Tenacibaculum sp. SSH1-16]
MIAFIKDFFKECLFFQTKDKPTKVIGATAWVIIGLASYLYYEISQLIP